jgi:hypothetical protein
MTMNVHKTEELFCQSDKSREERKIVLNILFVNSSVTEGSWRFVMIKSQI